MGEVLQLAHNATLAKIVNPSKELKKELSDLLSYMVEGAAHMPAFGPGRWDGRSSFYSMIKQTFPAGFVHLVHHELTRKGYKVQLIRKPLPVPLGPENPIVDEFGNDDPRYDFQMKALRAVERHGAGIVRIATGGGKSKVAKLIIARYRRPTLFLTTRGVLMYQMKKFTDKHFNTGVLGDGVWEPVRGINVGMVQTFVSFLKVADLNAEIRALVASYTKKGIVRTRAQLEAEAKVKVEAHNLRRQRVIKLLSIFEVVIGEEAHEAGGDSYYEILQYCTNARIRVGLTATPFMRDSAADNMRLMAAFGPVLIEVTEKMLIDRGILAKPFFKFEKVGLHPKLRRTSPYPRARQLQIVEGEARNESIVAHARKAKHLKMPVLVLVGLKEHGHRLVDLMKAAGIRALFLRGENNQAEREKALRDLKTGRIDCLIGTTILDVGVDVPAISLVILAGGGRAEVAHRQRIGRGLRAKDPNYTFILDFEDELNDHLRDHAKQRRTIIEATPGFAEGILPPGKDFDWNLFAAKKAA